MQHSYVSNCHIIFHDNGEVEIVNPNKNFKKLKAFVQFRCGFCNRFIKRFDLLKTTNCPHCKVNLGV